MRVINMVFLLMINDAYVIMLWVKFILNFRRSKFS